ncbi:MAG: CoA activase, partial [Myxococcota bacterium]
ARHPNVAVLDLSSFKCGHDAPTYGLIDSVIAAARTPYSTLHDVDANKPSGSIKIRVKTYSHTLMLAREALEDMGRKREILEVALAKKKLALLIRLAQQRKAEGAPIPAEVKAEIAALRDKLSIVVTKAENQAMTSPGGPAAALPPQAKKPSSLAVIQ